LKVKKSLSFQQISNDLLPNFTPEIIEKYFRGLKSIDYKSIENELSYKTVIILIELLLYFSEIYYIPLQCNRFLIYNQ